jgi:hypothetical protein
MGGPASLVVGHRQTERRDVAVVQQLA